MKRLVQVAGLCCLLAAVGWGQRGGFGGFHGGGFHGGGFRGGGFRGGFGGFHGFGGFSRFGFTGGFRHGFSHNRFFISSFNGGFPFPIGGIYGGYPFYGGFYYGAPYYGEPYYGQAAAAPNITVIYPPAASGPEYVSGGLPQPQAAQPYTREYQQPSAAPPAPGAPSVYFEIAMKDGTVYSALAYWVQGDALHFIDLDGKGHQVRVDQVDRQRSETLNKSRQIDFGLPAPR